MTADLDTLARIAALHRYTRAFDRFERIERHRLYQDRKAEAHGARIYADWVARAITAETDDPEPRR